MGEPALKIEELNTPRRPIGFDLGKESSGKSESLESMREYFLDLVGKKAQAEVQTSTEQALKLAQGDAEAQKQIEQSQKEARRDLEQAEAKANKKLKDSGVKLEDLDQLSYVKLPANDNDRAALKQAIEGKKSELEQLNTEESSKPAEKDKDTAELQKKKAEALRLEIQLLEQAKERDAVQRSLQKTEQSLEREREKPVPDPLALAGIEMDYDQQSKKLLELGASMVALDGLLGRTKHEVKRSEEKVEQNKVASAREKLKQIESTKKAQEQARRQENKSKVSAWSVAGGAVGTLQYGGFAGIAKIADWVDRGLDYITKYDWVDKFVNIVKLPLTIVNKTADWVEKKFGLEPDKKKPEGKS
jgi:hypothetical protein